MFDILFKSPSVIMPVVFALFFTTNVPRPFLVIVLMQFSCLDLDL